MFNIVSGGKGCADKKKLNLSLLTGDGIVRGLATRTEAHAVAILVQALAGASPWKRNTTMTMARFNAFTRGKIVGKAEEGAPRARIRRHVEILP